MNDTHSYSLVVLRKNDSELLISVEDGHYRLPSLEIPVMTRSAEQVTSRMRAKWNLTVVCRGNDAIAITKTGARYQVVEVRESNEVVAQNMAWITLKSLEGTDIATEVLDLIQCSIDPRNERGPFGEAGWLDELLMWMEPHLSANGLSLTGRFQQVNGSEHYNLIRFETNCEAVWFKAVGKPNLHEFPITIGLAERFPRFLPQIIATHRKWSGWLMKEFGVAIRDRMELDSCKNAASALARLQMNSTKAVDELLTLGCKDMRLSRVIDEIEPFLERAAELMQLQPRTPPPVLSRAELIQLGIELKEVCYRLEQTSIPDSLLHGDLNLGSVLVTSDQCIFTDWAEAGVGHPFISFEHLMAHIEREFPSLSAWREELQRVYHNAWESLLPPDKVAEAFRLARVVAVVVHALNRKYWRDPQQIVELNRSKNIRSLARRMRNELISLQASEVACHL